MFEDSGFTTVHGQRYCNKNYKAQTLLFYIFLIHILGVCIVR